MNYSQEILEISLPYELLKIVFTIDLSLKYVNIHLNIHFTTISIKINNNKNNN